MQKITKTVFSLVLLLNFSTSFAEQTIPNFTAIYDVTKAGIALGEMKSIYSIDSNNNYTYSSKTEPTGIARWFSSKTITETSSGKVKNKKHFPAMYDYKASDGDKKKTTTINFDYPNKKATDITDNKTISLQIDSSITDRQIVQILLMNDMLAGKTKLEYKVINKQEIKPYSFEILEQETVETELGAFKTTPVVRKREGSSRETTLWLAHDLYFLPVKIKQTKNGSDKFEMEIIKFEGINLPKPNKIQPQKEPAI